MSLRQTVYDALSGDAGVVSALAGGLHAGGSLSGAQAVRPFGVYRIQNEFAAVPGDDTHHSSSTTVEVWVYDDPGTFIRIEAAIEAIKTAMLGVPELRCTWVGTSPELPDDEQKAIVKNVVFTCKERTNGS